MARSSRVGRFAFREETVAHTCLGLQNNSRKMIDIEKAIQIIKKANPFMGWLLNCEEPLIDYCKKYITRHEFASEHLKRQEPYKKLIQEKIEKLFKNEDIKVNFDGGLILDTTDHHSILNFPSTVGAHLITRFDTIFNRKEKKDYFVLNCGNVPFNDALNKRGVQINGKHLNLYPKSTKNKLVSRYPLYKYNLMEWVNKNKKDFNESEIEFIKRLQLIIDNVDFSTCKKLSDQIIKINHKIWLEMFDPGIINDVRRCITLEHDEILIEFLTKFVLENEDNIVWKSLFDKKFREIVLKEFDGIYGAWNYYGKNSGTYFFWCFDEEDGQEYRLDLRGDVLFSPEKKARNIKLEPEDISRALNEGILIPSIFIKFATVAFYMGAKTCGGPGQTEYSGSMQKAWLKVLNISNYAKELELSKYWSVINFNCADMAFRTKKDGKIYKEWGLDIAMNHTLTKKYIEKISKIPIKFFIYPMIPISFYRLASVEERKQLNIKEEDLYKDLA